METLERCLGAAEQGNGGAEKDWVVAHFIKILIQTD
jgi:hypothetical protein